MTQLKKMTNFLHFYSGIFFIIILMIEKCAGFDTFFPLSMVQLNVPKLNNKTIANLNKISISKFNAISFNRKLNKTFNYIVDNSELNFLQINNNAGDVWIDENFNNIEKQNTFIISALNKPGASISARMSLTFIPQNVVSFDDFCVRFSSDLCFWKSVLYTTTEENKISVKEIGDLGPKGYLKLCQGFTLDYEVLNGSDYISIEDGTIYTKKPFDHDSFNPGPSLNVHVKCKVKKFNSLIGKYEKMLHITILDRNDNPPIIQDNKTVNLDLDDPHFKENGTIGQNSIIFLDQDSMAVNSRILYEIHSDIENIHPLCTGFNTDHNMLNSSVISCKIIFAHNGILRKSPYCFILTATDRTVEDSPINSSNATICIRTDLKKIHESEHPTAMALQSNPRADALRPRNQHSRKRERNFSSTADDLIVDDERFATSFLKTVNITYPSGVRVYKSATNFTRVAQPNNLILLMSTPAIKFRIIKDPINVFAITQLGGIIYVRDISALQKAPEAIYFLTISWQRDATTTIEFRLESDENITSSCLAGKEKPQSQIYACAEKHIKKDCLKYCGLAAQYGLCQWRDVNTSALTIRYATCSPDLTTCPDKICDPLEQLAHNYHNHLCPQDCTTHVVGPANKNPTKIGIFSGVGICSCDEFAKCTCGSEDHEPRNRTRSKNRNRNETLQMNFEILDPSATMASRDFNISTRRAMADQFDCGFPCLALIVGCPLLLIIIIIVLLITRRRFIRKCKRKLANGEILGYVREGNDTEIINVDIPLVSLSSDIKYDSNTKWEFPREQLSLDVTLGEGEFGKVVMGYATNIGTIPGITTVAVKMLKTGANSVELLALLSEFQLLQEVAHPNVIQLLGIVTHGESPLLILEYAQHGSLRNYLRLSRKLECSGIEFTNGVEPVTVKDILSFAWQICKGMAYLTEIKLVHRDLAARNVLLAKGKICKVSDFGLTRDVYEDDAYLKRSKDRVPVKWMAPESLADHVYTNRSDVWAFGVLAWELITLGASPYPGIPPQNLYHLLKTGYRMEKPENCSEEIYSIVRTCWADDPQMRPSFKSLSHQWEKLLGRTAKYLELEHLGVSNPVYCSGDNTQSPPLLNSPTDNEDIEDDLNHLWYPPHMHSRESAGEIHNDNRTDNNDLDSPSSQNTQQTIPEGYDAPRPLIETKTVEQKLRYENEISIPEKCISNHEEEPLNNKNKITCYINNYSGISQPNLVELRQKSALHYSHPVKRNKSYIDMAGEPNGIISDNLDTNDIDKKLSKDITFRFSSLLNLNEQMSAAI